MRIAQVAPLAESVPPKLYGGTERVISWLTEELVSLGHEVTLFASGDPQTSPNWCRSGRRDDGWAAQKRIQLSRQLPYSMGPRTVRPNTMFHPLPPDWVQLPLLTRLDVPFVTTTHNRLDLPGLSELVSQFPDAPFISISDNQRGPLPEARWLGTVYHGLPIDAFRPSYARGGYLAWVGWTLQTKAPEAAIRIAQAARMPLRIVRRSRERSTGTSAKK